MDIDKALEKAIKKSFLRIEKLFDEHAKLEFMGTPEDNLALYHFGLGTWIRTFILRNDRVIYKLFVKNGICHKDDMSALVIRELHRYMKNSGK